MAAIVNVPITGEDTEVYSFACDAAGGSGPGVPGGGLIQLTIQARYATILDSSTTPATPINWKPDTTHQAVRLVALLNGASTPLSAKLTLFDSVSGATAQFWSGTIPPGEPLTLNYPLTNGLVYELDVALLAGQTISLLAN